MEPDCSKVGTPDAGPSDSPPVLHFDQNAVAPGAGARPGPGIYTSDEFRMTAFKVLMCSNRAPHDWKRCPFAHPGEHARRRPLDTFAYCAEMCPHTRHSQPCPRGDACPFAHHVFEMWLHPERYKTQLCVDGASCKRRVCFFAHSSTELRTPSFAEARNAAAALELLSLQSANAPGSDAMASGGSPADHVPRRAPCVVAASVGSSGRPFVDGSRGMVGPSVLTGPHLLPPAAPPVVSPGGGVSPAGGGPMLQWMTGTTMAAPQGLVIGQQGAAASTAIPTTNAMCGGQPGVMWLVQAEVGAPLACSLPTSSGKGPGAGATLYDAVAVSNSNDTRPVLCAAYACSASGPLLTAQQQTVGLETFTSQALTPWEALSPQTTLPSAPLLQPLPQQVQQAQFPLGLMSLNTRPASDCMMMPMTSGGGWSTTVPTSAVYTATSTAGLQQAVQAPGGATHMLLPLYTHPAGLG